MSTKDAASLRQGLKDWLLKQNPGMDPGELKEQTPLMEQGLVDSLRLMDLVLTVERLCGRALDMEDVRPGAFRNIETISRTFFEVQP